MRADFGFHYAKLEPALSRSRWCAREGKHLTTSYEEVLPRLQREAERRRHP